MKPLILIGSVLVACGLVMGGCGNGESDPCTQMYEKVKAWSKEYCTQNTSGKTEAEIKEACCICHCLLMDQVIDDSFDCTCQDPPSEIGPPDDCTGPDLEEAEACLANEDLCRQTRVDALYATICFVG